MKKQEKIKKLATKATKTQRKQAIMNIEQGISNWRPKKVHFWPIFLFTFVWKTVNIHVCLPAGKRKPPVGAGFIGEPQVVVLHQLGVRLS